VKEPRPPGAFWPIVLPGAFLLLLFLISLGIFALRATRGGGAPIPPAPAGMVYIPGGTFQMGTDDPNPRMQDAHPVHRVTVRGFWMDRTEVTNAQFEAFVKASGYGTVAERKPDIAGVSPEKLVPGSIVFTPPSVGRVDLRAPYSWWSYVPGANWRHPEGPGSDLAGRESHPVVHIAWEDALAYAAWAGKRLPTEAEWEYAARGGLEQKRYTWGDELKPHGRWMANVWQGRFPQENTLEDGYARTAPVGSYPANGYGLFDMAGNVWEWCQDWYRPDYYATSPSENPRGPESSFDPAEPQTPKRVQRGGSFLCSDLYCERYVAAGRGKGEPQSSAAHLGFRCVKD
jgi:formylglycine-generating enzyme required for sulfatase activity